MYEQVAVDVEHLPIPTWLAAWISSSAPSGPLPPATSSSLSLDSQTLQLDEYSHVVCSSHTAATHQPTPNTKAHIRDLSRLRTAAVLYRSESSIYVTGTTPRSAYECLLQALRATLPTWLLA